MANAFSFSETEILAFAMVLLRVGSFVAVWPIFGTPSVPTPIKVLLALTLAFLLVPAINWKASEPAMLTNHVVWMALKEASVGLMLGFLCRLYFFAVSIGGQIISVSMGLSNAQILNPSLGDRGSSVEQFEVALATLIFLAMNGHHMFISGLVQSFEVFPMHALAMSFKSFSQFGSVVQEIVVVGTKIASPVLIAILFMNLSMGIVGRAVPQINVLITSLPVNILVGFLVLIVSVPLFVSEMDSLLTVMAERLFAFMKGL